jgi:hypothetical protein
MIINGAYSLGQLPEGTYDVYLNETSKTPGIWVRSVEIKKAQPSLPIAFELGDVSVSVKVYDTDGHLLDADDVDLLIGGTADDVHTWKKAKGLDRGVWQANHLYEGNYYVSATWDGNTVGALGDFTNGQNDIELSFANLETESSGGQHQH